MEIITERLRLREFVCDDWRAVLDYQRDPRYLRYYPWCDRTEDDARAFVGLFLDWQREIPRRRYQLAITRGSDHRLIGNCGIRCNPDKVTQAELGYELNPDHWGQGYATEAAAAILEFAFRQLELQRITSWCIADNVASARVLERLGFQMQRRSHAAEFFKGRWWDTLHYTLTADQWHDRATIVYIETDSTDDSQTGRNNAQSSPF